VSEAQREWACKSLELQKRNLAETRAKLAAIYAGELEDKEHLAFTGDGYPRIISDSQRLEDKADAIERALEKLREWAR